MTRTIDTALIGLGNVGRSFLHILETKGERIAAQYGLAFRLTCVADSSGVAVQPSGFDPLTLRQHKESGGRVSALDGYRPGLTPAEALADAPVDLLLEASPVNLQDGGPGLAAVRAALSRGIAAVLANKAPLVLAFAELQSLAKTNHAPLGWSATVCGALPVINIGQRDLVAADVSYLAGIFNSTSNFILGEMAGGRAYADALAEAQARGLAETDPSLDVEGWDTANKLVIIANSFLGVQATLADVQVQGITGLTAADLQAAQAEGSTIKLLAQAEQVPGGYRLSVGPRAIGGRSFLGQCDGWEMGIEIKSDLYGIMYHKIWEREPLPTAAAMLRDAVNLLGKNANALD
jgi:homoserine dehydrogenase